MRSIEGILSPELIKAIGSDSVDLAPAFKVKSYSSLMKHVANLSYLNKDYLIFFRGQGRDYKSKTGGSTLYPSIYRNEYLLKPEVDHRFNILKHASELLVKTFTENNIQGYKEIKRKIFIRWSILQHYGVCFTPLLDLTHSINVACSFAQIESENNEAYIYLFGLPYLTNRISINSEHDLVNIRLLSICPPDAMRPYYQEGYLAGTDDITNDYESKTELDFKNRLIAKFEIPSGDVFWDRDFSPIPESFLYPKGDRIGDICQTLKGTVESTIMPGGTGEFLEVWIEVERQILTKARKITDRQLTVNKAINLLTMEGLITKELMYEIDIIRKFRNKIAHGELKKIETGEVQNYITRIKKIKNKIVNNIF